VVSWSRRIASIVMSATLAGAHVTVSMCVAMCLLAADTHAHCHGSPATAEAARRAALPAKSLSVVAVTRDCCASLSNAPVAILPVKLARWSAQPVAWGVTLPFASPFALQATHVAERQFVAAPSPPRTPVVLRV
jgi:hypothetical protein